MKVWKWRVGKCYNCTGRPAIWSNNHLMQPRLLGAIILSLRATSSGCALNCRKRFAKKSCGLRHILSTCSYTKPPKDFPFRLDGWLYCLLWLAGWDAVVEISLFTFFATHSFILLFAQHSSCRQFVDFCFYMVLLPLTRRTTLIWWLFLSMGEEVQQLIGNIFQHLVRWCIEWAFEICILNVK